MTLYKCVKDAELCIFGLLYDPTVHEHVLFKGLLKSSEVVEALVPQALSPSTAILLSAKLTLTNAVSKECRTDWRTGKR